MAQTTPPSRTDAQTIFRSRLYGGMIGSGKSVSISHDIRTLLDAEQEYRIIDIVGLIRHDRPGLDEEFGTFCDTDDAGHPSHDLYDALQERAYVRVDGDHGAMVVEQAAQRIRHTFEHAIASAQECEWPTVVVLDGHLWASYDEDTILEFAAEARKHGVAIWVSDQEPFRTGFAEKWAGNSGEIVLHDVPKYDVPKYDVPKYDDAERRANLTDADRQHVSTVAIGTEDGNQVLVGTPGNWEQAWVPHPGEVSQ